MVDLFNENTLFVLFFAMVAIYNYSALKEYQRMAIIYISIYALAALFFLNLFTRPRRFGKTLNSLRVFLKLEQIERCLMVSIFPGYACLQPADIITAVMPALWSEGHDSD